MADDSSRQATIIRSVLLLFTLMLTVMSGSWNPGAAAPAAQSGPALDCRPLTEQRPELLPPTATTAPPAAGLPAATLTSVTIGYVPVSIYAPIFVAEALGYYEEFGLDVTLTANTGGSDLITLTAAGNLDISAAGAGPAFWNANAQDLPITVIAPGHQEGSPVATPLMISRAACESGAITSLADLVGKRVSVNAPGGTEFWLGSALATAGLTIDDVDEQFLPFPDAVAALDSGAIDAAMIGEPLATQAELDGFAVRLLPDFPVQGVQPTTIIANDDFLAANPDVATGFVAAYLKASRVLSGDGFKDPAVLAIIGEYTGVPADLARLALQPVYQPNGQISFATLAELQTFFRGRDQLEYDTDIDPASIADTQYVNGALALIGTAPVLMPATPAAAPAATPVAVTSSITAQ